MAQIDGVDQNFRERSSLAMTTRDAAPLTYASTITIATMLVIGEVVIHGFVVPLLGAYLGSVIINTHDPESSEFLEILVTILAVIVLMRAAIYWVSFEAPYFKRCFILDKGYDCMLLIRECLNLIVLLGSLYYLFTCIQNIAGDGGLKETYLGEKLGDLSYHYFAKCRTYFIDAFDFSEYELIIVKEEPSPSWISRMIQKIWWSTEDTRVKAEEDLLESKDGHAAQLLLAIALVAASIIKMVYLTVLSTYLRSVDILVKMNFNCTLSEDNEEDTDSATEDDVKESEDEETLTAKPQSNELQTNEPKRKRRNHLFRHHSPRNTFEKRKPRLTKTNPLKVTQY